MEYEEIQKLIISACEDLGCSFDFEPLSSEEIDEVNIEKDLRLDDIDVVEFYYSVQERIELSIDEEEFIECETIGEICDFIYCNFEDF